MNCKHCGRPIENSSRRCKHCGLPQTDMICAISGEPLTGEYILVRHNRLPSIQQIIRSVGRQNRQVSACVYDDWDFYYVNYSSYQKRQERNNRIFLVLVGIWLVAGIIDIVLMFTVDSLHFLFSCCLAAKVLLIVPVSLYPRLFFAWESFPRLKKEGKVEEAQKDDAVESFMAKSHGERWKERYTDANGALTDEELRERLLHKIKTL